MTGEVDARKFVAQLEAAATEEQRAAYRRYFPGDESFIGVRMGTVFGLAKEFMEMGVDQIEALLESPIHEVRVGACSVMGKAATHKSCTPARHEALYRLYLRRHDRINDWDLVDLAAHQVLGTWLLDRPRNTLYHLACSRFWPERRSAVVATAAFLKRGQVGDTLALARILLSDEHDLVRKGAGWMLRCASQVDELAFRGFVEEVAESMPRVMLRAAVEKLQPEERKRYLAIRRASGSKTP